jgi:hypothetical protein
MSQDATNSGTETRMDSAGSREQGAGSKKSMAKKMGSERSPIRPLGVKHKGIASLIQARNIEILVPV